MTTRRTDPLTRERIVEATIGLLDEHGDAALTFRALTGRLATGPGALYHHVASKGELLDAATDELVGRALEGVGRRRTPRAALRAVGVAIFDVIDEHPWVGTHLSREPGQPALLRIWRTLGAHLEALGLSAAARADAGSTLVSYVLGAAAQHAAGARTMPDPAQRQAYLDALADRLEPGDPVAVALRDHDDRRQFLAGVEIVLRGLATPR